MLGVTLALAVPNDLGGFALHEGPRRAHTRRHKLNEPVHHPLEGQNALQAHHAMDVSVEESTEMLGWSHVVRTGSLDSWPVRKQELLVRML